jgi:hypothetical protein
MRHNTEGFFGLVGKSHGNFVMFAKRGQVIAANLRGLSYGG